MKKSDIEVGVEYAADLQRYAGDPRKRPNPVLARVRVLQDDTPSVKGIPVEVVNLAGSTGHGLDVGSQTRIKSGLAIWGRWDEFERYKIEQAEKARQRAVDEDALAARVQAASDRLIELGLAKGERFGGLVQGEGDFWTETGFRGFRAELGIRLSGVEKLLDLIDRRDLDLRPRQGETAQEAVERASRAARSAATRESAVA